MSKTWKAAESRIGAWLGAKGIGRSGRLPLSGGNSGRSRSDHPHPTIFNECKRDKTYHNLIKYWCKLKDGLNVGYSAVVDFKDGICCFHCNDVEKILSGDEKIKHFSWPIKKRLPRAYMLFRKTEKVKATSEYDKDKKVVSCTFVYHNHHGFWVVMRFSQLKLWWDCILEARKERERLLAEENK